MALQCKESVYMLPDEVLESNDSRILRLKHPQSNTSCCFLLSVKKQKLYELQGFDEKFRSWIIKDKVHSDGCINIATPYNPIFLILPYLIQATKNVPLDHLLEDEKFPAMPILAAIVEDLSCVADRKGSPSLNVWSYNESSALKWLSDKVEKISSKLFDHKERPSLTSSVAYDKESYKLLAFGILSENLSGDLSAKLKAHLKIPEVEKAVESSKRSNTESSKRTKLEAKSPDSEPRAKKAPVVKQSAKSKALAKSAKGSKSITSFFTEK